MSFIWPLMLGLLVVVPLFIAMYVRMQRRRKRLAEQYGSLGLVQGAGGRTLGARRHLPAVLFTLALAVLIIAMARPKTVVSLPRVEGTVILAFDVSGSMAADDIQPTRMEAAKTAARAFVERQPSTVLIGVVSFSESGFAVQPPTNDQALILSAINRLAPTRGTSLASGIQMALNTIGTAEAKHNTRYYTNLTPMPSPTPTPVPEGVYKSAAIVLLTDGENNVNPNPLLAAQAAADRGVRIHTIGVGSPTGTTLTVDGFTVHTQLDEAMLRQISGMTNGLYQNAQNEQELRAIYDNLGTQLVIKAEDTEVTSILAGIGILGLLLGGLMSLMWFSRLP